MAPAPSVVVPVGIGALAALIAGGAALGGIGAQRHGGPPPAARSSVVTGTGMPPPAPLAVRMGPWRSGVQRAGAAAHTRFRWPLTPRPAVTRRFAVGPNPWSPGHRGVDLAAAAGEPVMAAGAGVVAFAGRVAGVPVVVVAHAGGIRTTYQPVEPAVRSGRTVRAGDLLGALGTWPGHCAGPCLHWGALRSDRYIDPLTLLGLVPPVLLPVLPVAAGVR